MKQLAITLISFLAAASASAALLVSPERVDLRVGERARIEVTWVTWGTTGGLLEFVSSDPSVALAEGTLLLPRGTHGASTKIVVEAVGPGEASIRTVSGVHVATVDVTCGFIPQPKALTPSLVTRAGSQVTLEVVAPLLPNTVYTWYIGRAGDTTNPLRGSGPFLQFSPIVPGVHHLWVSVATPCSYGTAEFLVEATAVRRRAVR